jgi:dihydrolipoamide dehydrogenase
MTTPASEPFHTVVIGAGAGGLTVAVGLARLGRSVALVEAGDVGGDCTNVGCIPSKTLIELARRCARRPPEARAAAARAALAETRRRRDDLRTHEEGWLDRLAGLSLVRGQARLARGTRATPDVLVRTAAGDERRLQAGRIVLATGSEAVMPALPGLPAGDDPARAVHTNASIFELEAPPEHLVIAGAGTTGCELAFAFARLGSRVTLLEAADRVLPREEAAASELIGARLAGLGVAVMTDTALGGFDERARTVTLAPVGAPAAPETATLPAVDRLLVAVGRRPRSAGLGLEDVNVRVDGRGAVIVAGGYRTTAPNVFAIGDLIGGASTHVAHAHGRRLVRFLTVPLPLLPEGEHSRVAFTEPEVAQVGPTLARLRRRWPDPLLAVHRVDLAETDRGRTLGLRDGFLQVVALRGSGRLLAATLVAPGAGELLPLLTWAQRRRVSLWQLSRLEVAYPALGEAVRMAADAFVFASLPRLDRELVTYLRWRWRRGAGG